MEAVLALVLAGVWLLFLARLALWFANKVSELDAGVRKRFALLPVRCYVSEFYQSGGYWLRTVVERKTRLGWKAFESDNPGWKAFKPSRPPIHIPKVWK